ncbi:MAG: choloylglycine hydrolase family protein [Clostridia bacterium]|nr:choloylglycine hydrolase family protein [Clostridia bacterium]
MCTAISYVRNGNYFIRTLDLECSLGEKIVLTGQKFPLSFLFQEKTDNHPAILGMALVRDNFPLYYDAVNDKGLSMAGLNFPEYASYKPYREGMFNVASFELIPWILSNCGTVADACALLASANIVDTPFCPDLPPTPMHWIISDKSRSITVEPLADGLKIQENPVGVLTNSPSFDYHLTRLSDYMSLTSHNPENRLCPKTKLVNYSRGLGAVGLPGDFSSSSRFIRAVFVKEHTRSGGVERMLHIGESVSVPMGCIKTDKGEDVSTVYTSVIDRDRLVYYATTEQNRRVRAVALASAEYGSDKLLSFPLGNRPSIEFLN